MRNPPIDGDHPISSIHHRSFRPYGSPLAMAATFPIDLTATVQAARLGEEWAFNTLAEEYRTAAERLAQQILRTEEAAADAVQEALIKAYRAMPRFQEGNFRSWLLRIVTNTCYDHLRRQKRRLTLSLDESADWVPLEVPSHMLAEAENPETVALRQESLRLLLQAIEDLPAWHRNVVLLVDVHGYDYNEAAEVLGLPLGTVKSRLSRARSALRDALVASGPLPSHS
jgi:RNA polymerase sigma-70 factor (ECF subfamily)